MADISAFGAVGSPQSPADVHDLLGVGVGLSAAVTSTKIDDGAFQSLPFLRLDGGTVDLPASVLAPLPLVHARVGLPGGFDLGVKYGGLNFDSTQGDAKSEYESRVLGAEVRKRLCGGGVTGVALPDVAVAVAYDRATGKITRTERYNALVTGGSTLDAATTWKSDWNTGAVTARVTASKTLLILTPYVGVGYTKFTGRANTSVSIVGTDSGFGAVNETADANADPRSDLVQISGGLQVTVLPLVKLNLGGLWAEDRWAGTLGLGVSFR